MSVHPTASEANATVASATMLVAWTRSWRAGLTSIDEIAPAVLEASAQVMRGEYDHVIQTDQSSNHTSMIGKSEAPQVASGSRLSAFLPTCSSIAPDDIRLALPIPGEPIPASQPAPFNTAALTAQCAVTIGTTGLVPQVVADRMVIWTAYPLAGVILESTDSLAAHDLELSEALHTASPLLSSWGGATLSPQEAAALAEIRSDEVALPAGYSARARAVATRANMVLRILALAANPPSGAATSTDMQLWIETTRDLARCARHAYTAAINAPLV